MRSGGKGRLQEEDAPAPDLSDFGASIPQFNSMSSTSSSLIGAAANMPRATQRTILSNTAAAPGLFQRESSDSKNSASSISGSDLSSPLRNPPSESVDAGQEALLKQIGTQASCLENLRIKLLQSFQVTDDSLCDDADQLDTVQEQLDYIDDVCKTLDSHLDQVEREQSENAGRLGALLSKLASETARCQVLDSERKGELQTEVEDLVRTLAILDHLLPPGPRP